MRRRACAVRSEYTHVTWPTGWGRSPCMSLRPGTALASFLAVGTNRAQGYTRGRRTSPVLHRVLLVESGSPQPSTAACRGLRLASFHQAPELRPRAAFPPSTMRGQRDRTQWHLPLRPDTQRPSSDTDYRIPGRRRASNLRTATSQPAPTGTLALPASGNYGVCLSILGSAPRRASRTAGIAEPV